jgi:RimJ/RimL family protein N-acetyltransferase/nitroimidazol reductase NimA-like FMN-containing flavoprotein (pyridoxamine 5'-phosphate oxidase superfamily)
MTESFTPTGRTTGLRLRERVSYERATAYAIIDEAYHCHVGFVVGGEPRVLPTLAVRVDDTLYVHGSSGSRPFLAARADGLPVCVTVTHLDGLVLARSQFHHSANYRSVVAHGRAHLVTDPEEKLRVLTALVEKVARGRSAETRPPNPRELAETNVLALPLTEVSVKARMGGVNDEPEDYALPYWAGVVPLRLTPGVPDPDAGVRSPVPANLQPDRSPWLQAPTLRGDHVVLEALDVSHVDDMFAHTGDDEVWQHLPRLRPKSPEELAGYVREALRAQASGVRVTWAQRCARTGAVVGMTSYYAPDEVNRSLAVGYTLLGRAWWRTGINTEAKLLLLGRAFDELGVERVEWHTDIRNARSQRAIERLGAVREGVLRRHKLRPDGSWRDSVLYAMTAPEWPAARERLRERLRAPAPVG